MSRRRCTRVVWRPGSPRYVEAIARLDEYQGCLLKLTDDPRDRQPCAYLREFTPEEAPIKRNLACPYLCRCLGEAAAHEWQSDTPKIHRFRTWVCAPSCPYREEVEATPLPNLFRRDCWVHPNVREPFLCIDEINPGPKSPKKDGD